MVFFSLLACACFLGWRSLLLCGHYCLHFQGSTVGEGIRSYAENHIEARIQTGCKLLVTQEVKNMARLLSVRTEATKG